MTRNSAAGPLWMLYSCFLLLAGAAFFAAQSWQAFRLVDGLRRTGVLAEGTVVEVLSPGGRYPTTVYVVEYTVRRTPYRLTTQCATHHIHERVRVRYAPAAPQVAMLNEACEGNAWAMYALASAAVLAFSGLFYKGYCAAGKAATP